MYTTVLDRSAAIVAAARLARNGASADGAGDLCARLPLLVDQVAAEAGVLEPRICAHALTEARGDLARAVSLVRAWAATLPRLAGCTVTSAGMRPLRRITPAFADPPGGQYLGASLDYAQRLLDLDDAPASPPDEPGPAATTPPARPPGPFPRALDALERQGLVAGPEDGPGREGLLRRLARGETGAMTALAYSAIRGSGQRSDPTLVELRQGLVPVTVGELVATCAEVVLYRVHDGVADPRLTAGAARPVGGSSAARSAPLSSTPGARAPPSTPRHRPPRTANSSRSSSTARRRRASSSTSSSPTT